MPSVWICCCILEGSRFPLCHMHVIRTASLFKKMNLNIRSRHLAKDSEKFGGNGTEKTLKSEQLVQCVVNWILHPALGDSASLISLHPGLYWKPSALPGGKYRFCLIFVSWGEMENQALRGNILCPTVIQINSQIQSVVKQGWVIFYLQFSVCLWAQVSFHPQ